MKRGAVCLALAALAVCGCNGGSTTTVVERTETATETVQSPGGTSPASRPGTDGAAFQTPTGNISCFVAADFVNCSIYKADWTPTDEPSCPTDAGRSVSLVRNVPTFKCGTPEPATGVVLPYGQEVARGSYGCLSQTSGLRCHGFGHGFVLAREDANAY